MYQLITTLPAYPQPSVDYEYKLGYIPYPSWTFACRDNPSLGLTAATDHILFRDSEQAVRITAGVVVPCAIILAVLLRAFFIGRHCCDTRNKSAYNVMNVTDEEIEEQMPNFDIRKSYRKECVLFVFELVLLCAMFGVMVFAIYTLTEDSRWIKQILKNQCTDSYL